MADKSRRIIGIRTLTSVNSKVPGSGSGTRHEGHRAGVLGYVRASAGGLRTVEGRRVGRDGWPPVTVAKSEAVQGTKQCIERAHRESARGATREAQAQASTGQEGEGRDLRVKTFVHPTVASSQRIMYRT